MHLWFQQNSQKQEILVFLMNVNTSFSIINCISWFTKSVSFLSSSFIHNPLTVACFIWLCTTLEACSQESSSTSIIYMPSTGIITSFQILIFRNCAILFLFSLTRLSSFTNLFIFFLFLNASWTISMKLLRPIGKTLTLTNHSSNLLQCKC